MELRQLVYFEAVVRCGGFTRAAQSLHVAQPAVSAQIRRLETELGVDLLARTTRRVALTAAGELLLTRTRRLLAELNGVRSDLDELAGVLRGRVVLGATQVLGAIDLPAALAIFHAGYPGVALTLRSGLIAPLLVALDADEVDLVLGPIHADLPAKYVAQQLVEEQLVVITATSGGTGLSNDSRLTLSDLRAEPFVCLPAGSGLHAILTAAAHADGFEPHIQFETTSPASIRELVSAGLGVALLARSAATPAGPPVHIHTLDPAPAHPPIGVIQRRDHSPNPAAQAFLTHLAAASNPSGTNQRALRIQS